MKTKFLISLLLLSALLPKSNSFAAIYGEDSRKEIIESSALTQQIATGVAITFSKIFLQQNADSTYSLDFKSSTLKSEWDSCSDERFLEQPSSSPSCTGFLIAEDILVTAGHCAFVKGEVRNKNNPFCQDFLWMFDYQYKSKNNIELSNVPAEKIFQCQKILYASYKYDQPTFEDKPKHIEDFAIIKLDRKAKGRHYFKLAAELPPTGHKLTALGFPLGLPMKHSTGKLLSRHKENYLHSNLDIIGGNSGSPILNEANEVIGITSHGYDSSQWSETRQCMALNRCDENATQCEFSSEIFDHPGEYAFLIDKVRAYMKKANRSAF